MNTPKNSAKKQNRKFNFIFFVDSEKTYHYKLNFLTLKILLFLFVFIFLSSIVSMIIFFSLFYKYKNQEKYIVQFKQELLMNSFKKDGLPLKVIENSNIKIEKEKIIKKDNIYKILFSLSNKNKNSKIISGKICAIAYGLSTTGEQKKYKIPQSLITDEHDLPLSCYDGEHIKFNKLRPIELQLNTYQQDFTMQKVKIFFLNEEEKFLVTSSFEIKNIQKE